MMKKTVSMLLAVVMIFALIPSMVFAEPVTEGSCGKEEGMVWTLNEEGVLTIDGKGEMRDWTAVSDTPWFGQQEAIKSVEVASGVTSVGANAFAECINLASVVFAGNAPVIAQNAFTNVEATIYYPMGDETWTEDVVQNYGGTLDWESVCMEHHYVDKVVNPTYTAKGYTLHTCSICGETYKDNTTDMKSLSAPKVTVSNVSDGIKVSWNKIAGATGYQVWRRTGSGEWKLIKTITSASTTSFTNTGRTNGTKYRYRVRAIILKNDVVTKKSAYSATATIYRITATTITKSVNTKNGIKIEWNKMKNATGYKIYRKDTNNTSWKLVKTITDGKTTAWTNTKRTDGVRYYYKVVVCRKIGDTTYTSAASNTRSVTRLSAPTISSISNTNNGIKIKWNKITGASGYQVYRKTNNGEWKLVKTIKKNATTTWTNTERTNGSKYQYKVRAILLNADGKVSRASVFSGAKTMYRLTKPTIASVKNTDSREITVKWNKNTKASGYQVKYVTGDVTHTTKVKGTASLSKVLADLNAEKVYNITVRCYKTVGDNTYYSPYSSAKSVRVKADPKDEWVYSKAASEAIFDYLARYEGGRVNLVDSPELNSGGMFIQEVLDEFDAYGDAFASGEMSAKEVKEKITAREWTTCPGDLEWPRCPMCKTYCYTFSVSGNSKNSVLNAYKENSCVDMQQYSNGYMYTKVLYNENRGQCKVFIVLGGEP